MSNLAKGAVIAGKYRLESLIGRGGMGSVWVAHHLQLDTDVAVKFLDSLTDAGDARARFKREAETAAKIRSPHVVQILDYGVDGDQPYIVMELLEGEDLGERLRREKRLSVKAAAVILTQAAKALRRAHDVGVVHRDLKPSNIFLARFDEDEVVKLLDFGVAKIRNPGIDTGSEFTQTGVIFGSPAYMSPEQARGVKVIDHRSDLWSLAVILFRALTGEKPFEAASIGDLVIKLCIDPLPVASAIAPDLSPEIDAFFLKSFARELDQRFSAAMIMAAEFEALAARSAAPRTLGMTVVMEDPPTPAAPPAGPRPQADPRPAPHAAPAIAPIAPAPGHAPQPSPVAWSAPAAILPPPAPPPSTPVTGALTGPFPAPPPMPSVTPQPPSRTPSPTLRAVTPSARTPADPKRLLLWTAFGGGAVVLLALIIGVSRPRRPPEPSAEPTATAAVAPPPEDPAPAAAPPPPSAAPMPSAESSAAPDTTSLPEEPTAEPTAAAASASGAAAPFGRPPRGSGGKAGKGRVPNFGY